MEIKVTSEDTDPWEGPLEELLERQELSELVERRVRGLRPGERVSFDYPTRFTVERTD